MTAASAVLDKTPNAATSAFDPFNPPPPDESDERARMVRALRLTDRFALFVATCNRADVRHQIVDEIKAENPDLRLVEVSVDRNVPNLLAYLSTLPDVQGADGVFVSGLENFLPNTEEVAQSSFVVNLNGTRDAFPKTLSCPLVLWLADYARNGVMQGAPDFYSIRSASFVFATPLPDAPEIERLVTDSEYTAAWRLSFQERENRIKELNDLLTQLQSLPDKQQDGAKNFAVSERLTGLYLACGRYDDADMVFNHLFLISQKVFGRSHPNTLVVLGNWASLYIDMGQFAKAEELIMQGLDLIPKDNAMKAVEAAFLMDKLAAVYQNQNKVTEAEQLLTQALAIKERYFGEESKEVAVTVSNLARNYTAQKRFSDAMPLFTRAMNISMAHIGLSHPNTLSTLNNLAALHYQQGNLLEADALFMRLLTLRKAELGLEHPDVAVSLNNVAAVRQSQGRLYDAEDLYRQAEAINIRVFGAEHPYTKAVQNHLMVLAKQMRTKQAFQPMPIKPSKKRKPTGKKA